MHWQRFSVISESCHRLRPCHDPASVVSRSCLSCVTILPQLCHDHASVVSRSCLSCVTILPHTCHDHAPYALSSCIMPRSFVVALVPMPFVLRYCYRWIVTCIVAHLWRAVCNTTKQNKYCDSLNILQLLNLCHVIYVYMSVFIQ